MHTFVTAVVATTANYNAYNNSDNDNKNNKNNNGNDNRNNILFLDFIFLPFGGEVGVVSSKSIFFTVVVILPVCHTSGMQTDVFK